MYKFNNNHSRSINLEATYHQLKSAIEKRCGYQEYYNNLWSNVKRGNNRSSEIKNTADRIGTCTHEINDILSNLSKCKKCHKAMNMAHGYLLEEIRRTKNIIASWQRSIHKVNNGELVWVNSRGVTHTDSTNPKAYLAKKQRYLMNLTNWDNSISRYLI